MAARRYDPDRRGRLAEAAVRVISRDGVAGLSHRAVAAEADVPLGSTTYHYATLDDLLLAALRLVNEAWLERFRAWSRALAPGRPLAPELASFLVDSVGASRVRSELAYEFYFTGLRNAAVRPLAAECLDSMTGILRRHVPDERRARAVVALLDGLAVQLLLTGRDADHAQLGEMFERLLPEDGDVARGGGEGGGPGSSPAAHAG